jgi:hypothetical protein
VRIWAKENAGHVAGRVVLTAGQVQKNGLNKMRSGRIAVGVVMGETTLIEDWSC